MSHNFEELESEHSEDERDDDEDLPSVSIQPLTVSNVYTREEARVLVTKYGDSTGHNYKIVSKSSGGSNFMLACTGSFKDKVHNADCCSSFFRFTLVKGTGSYKLTVLNFSHGNCSIIGKVKIQEISARPGVKELVLTNIKFSRKDLSRIIGINLEDYQKSRICEQVFINKKNKSDKEYKFLIPLIIKLVLINPLLSAKVGIRKDKKDQYLEFTFNNIPDCSKLEGGRFISCNLITPVTTVWWKELPAFSLDATSKKTKDGVLITADAVLGGKGE